VADEGREAGRPRAGAGARTGARTWPTGGSRRPWASAWPRPEFAVPARMREWALAEVGTGRLLPWFAVAFGAGIVLYFTAEREPVWWAPSTLAAVSAASAVLLRRRPLAFVIALGFFAAAAGFTVATLKTALIDHPVLRYPGIVTQTPHRRSRPEKVVGSK
jgi:competence protein ComEC